MIQHESLKIFRRIFLFLGCPEAELPGLLRIARENSLFSGYKNPEEIREFRVERDLACIRGIRQASEFSGGIVEPRLTRCCSKAIQLMFAESACPNRKPSSTRTPLPSSGRKSIHPAFAAWANLSVAEIVDAANAAVISAVVAQATFQPRQPFSPATLQPSNLSAQQPFSPATFQPSNLSARRTCCLHLFSPIGHFICNRLGKISSVRKQILSCFYPVFFLVMTNPSSI